MWCGGSGDDVEGFTWKAALLLSFGSSQPKVVPRSSPSGAKVRSKFLLKIPEFLEILVQHPPPTPTLPLSGLISVVLEFYHRKSQQWCLYGSLLVREGKKRERNVFSFCTFPGEGQEFKRDGRL